MYRIFRNLQQLALTYATFFIKFIFISFMKKVLFIRPPRKKLAFFRGVFVFILMFSWIFSGWPQVGDFPQKLQEVRAGEIIAYKSAGAGTMTETNGASLAPVAPATVDAGDILIAHIVVLDSTSAPSTPSGWTLLFGPSGLGTGTPTGRAWAYGKIADGSEDGAVINFGSLASTIGRMGRIYSFSGYVSGAITDVVPVASFIENSSETDPIIEPVTTTISGAKAVSLVSQDDNNSHAGLGAVTGGTWVEAVADYVNASVGAQGGALQIQVGTPTADPGTITGGIVAGTNDEANTLSFEIRSNAPVVTTPFDDARQAIINGLDSAQSEGTGWDTVVKIGQNVAGVVRTSDTVVTIMLDAFASYDIVAQEMIAVTIPAMALLNGVAIIATPTFTIDIVAGLSTAIEVRAQNYTTAISTITFPEGAPETTVSQPYNDIDGVGSPQIFGGAGIAKPVVTLYNGGGTGLIIWYNITTFTNGIVSDEYYLINDKGAICADASAINNAAVFDTDTDTGTTIAAGAGNEKDLYLKTVLSLVAGKTGNSTLTILGETP
ncbi:TPA: hypothetical protein DCZ15_03650 [Candidatus Falkowbacteria bacterium]|nr:hypothetical protein [Candidatus Falkowbacteria bacterium]